MLLRFGPHCRFAVLVNHDVNHVGPAAYGTIFDVFLPRAGRAIDGDHDFLAAGIAGIACVFNHPGDSTGAMAPLVSCLSTTGDFTDGAAGQQAAAIELRAPTASLRARL